MARRRKTTLSDDAGEALKKFEETTSFHTTMIGRVRDRYRAYRGLMEADSDADGWESKLHPPYVNHIIETTMAALVDDKLSYKIKPKAKFYNDREERESAIRGAEAHEILMRYQLSKDHFDEKLRPFVLQNCIVGVSVAKTLWRSDTRKKKYLEVVDVGQQEMGVPGLLYDLKEAERIDKVYDGPCTEVVNIEDFYWHESAVEIQRSPIIGHVIWNTFEELKQSEKNGEYSNVDELKESREIATDSSAYDLDDRRRTKDMIEVLELWWLSETGIKTCTLGNRKVELKAPRNNPFWHGEYPFVVCSTQPDLFKVMGTSQVQKIAHLQDATWDMLNQTHDNVRLCNNFIVAYNTSMIEDPDAMEWAPGERWAVEGAIGEAIQQFVPNASVTQIALPHISALQNDMQNLAGGHPFTTTSEGGRQGAGTATEAALVTNLAQAAAKAMKMQLTYSYKRIGQQRMELNQQFIRRPLMVEQIGLDQAEEFKEIAPHILQGDYEFDIEPMNESLMRSERKAEANAMMQMYLQLAPINMPLSQTGAATPLNQDAFTKYWLDAYVDDSKPFFSDKKPPPTAGGAPPGGPPGSANGQAAPPGPSGGVTSELATNPSNSPSAQVPLSPVTQMQQMLAQRGGIANT